MLSSNPKKRSRSPSPPPWQRQPKSPRKETQDGRQRDTFAKEQSRRNQARENQDMQKWLSEEDDFVLRQSKKKAKIRIREGRAKPIDWLAMCLGIADTTSDMLEEESALPDFDVPEPIAIMNGLPNPELEALEKDIAHYLALEKGRENRVYWNAAKVVCEDRIASVRSAGPSGRGLKSVSTDIDKILQPKSLAQVNQLEKQVKQKLDSNEPIDEDYWEQLLARIGVFKARAQLGSIFASIVARVAEIARLEHIAEAEQMKKRFAIQHPDLEPAALEKLAKSVKEPETLLGLSDRDKGLKLVNEADFLSSIAADRQKVRDSPRLQLRKRDASAGELAASGASGADGSSRLGQANVDSSHATKLLYDREAARGVEEDEEIFAGEEIIASSSEPQWSDKYRPRKPRYFNRVQMGYEWNKYNQTHYDHDNPPPKVVQGYKFNIFYPELMDKTKAPTYRVERENGRKRGQTFAPAGEEDTCLIRFIAGPPYEDIAFRIVDKEWDYSAKRERGFRSSFDKGILQLHFHFKKVYYRK